MVGVKNVGRQVAKLAVDVTLHAIGPVRRLSGGHPDGKARFGPRGAISTPHGLITENSAQIPGVWLISHRLDKNLQICIFYVNILIILLFLVTNITRFEGSDYCHFQGPFASSTPLFRQRLLAH